MKNNEHHLKNVDFRNFLEIDFGSFSLKFSPSLRSNIHIIGFRCVSTKNYFIARYRMQKNVDFHNFSLSDFQRYSLNYQSKPRFSHRAGHHFRRKKSKRFIFAQSTPFQITIGNLPTCGVVSRKLGEEKRFCGLGRRYKKNIFT